MIQLGDGQYINSLERMFMQYVVSGHSIASESQEEISSFTSPTVRSMVGSNPII